MRPAPLVLLVLAPLAACSGGTAGELPKPGPPTESGVGAALPSPSDDALEGAVDLRRCSGQADDTALARCSASVTGSTFALAVCGDLVGDNTIDVEGNVAASGDFTVSSPATVRGDAWIGGRVDARNVLTVRGTLHAEAPMGDHIRAGALARGASSPLACDRAVDALAYLRGVKSEGVQDRGAALNRITRRTEVRLGCGRYRFESIGADNELTLRVEGRTVVVVDHSVRAGSPIRVELAPGATLDFIVGGSLEGDNVVSFRGGSTWLVIGDRVRVGSPMSLDGWLVAPTAEILADNTLDVRGAVFARHLRAGSPVRITRGPALLGDGCSAAWPQR